ncbi:hypothetical protein ACWFR5_07800 [Streptomyces sp. NPDC055092]
MKFATMRTAGTAAAARIADDNAVETGNRDPGSLLADDGWNGLAAAAAAAADSPRPTARHCGRSSTSSAASPPASPL